MLGQVRGHVCPLGAPDRVIFMSDRFFPLGIMLFTVCASALAWAYALMTQLPLD
jgi:hypothetical protein